MSKRNFTGLDGAGFTEADVRESIQFMRRRFDEGQGGLHESMCRLSLPMSEFLIGLLDRHALAETGTAPTTKPTENKRPGR